MLKSFFFLAGFYKILVETTKNYEVVFIVQERPLSVSEWQNSNHVFRSISRLSHHPGSTCIGPNKPGHHADISSFILTRRS
jgi:hypothetical protein